MIPHSPEGQPSCVTVNHTFKDNQEEEFTCSPQIEQILFGEIGMALAAILESYIPTTHCNIVVHEQKQMWVNQKLKRNKEACMLTFYLVASHRWFSLIKLAMPGLGNWLNEQSPGQSEYLSSNPQNHVLLDSMHVCKF